jgi:hypothetical protein
MSTNHLCLSRRRLLVLSAATLVACDRPQAGAQPPASPLSEEERALKHKFRGLDGGELYVDALTEKAGVNIFDEKGQRFYASASLSFRNNSRYSYGAEFGVPKVLRVEWRDPQSEFRAEGPNGTFVGGTILGNHTVPVASRIPDALLDDLRKNGGGFRLKIRLHDDGPLIGWDIQRAYGSAPDGSAFHHAGGDFQEARPFIKFADEPRAFVKPGTNPILARGMAKGWYIHPKTKQKIETDF